VSRRGAGSSRATAPRPVLDRSRSTGGPEVEGSRTARPSRSGRGARSPAPRESRTTAASVAAASSHGTPQASPAVRPCRSSTAENTAPRGCIGLPLRSRASPASATPANPPAARATSTTVVPSPSGVGDARLLRPPGPGAAVKQRSVAT
jgi:hypothetical protein